MEWFLLLGVVSGMRTMTAIAVLCWFAFLGEFPPTVHSWAFWTAKLVSVIVFTIFALGEYFGDVQPQTPSRKALPLVLARACFGALCGAVGAAAVMQPAAGGAILGLIGAMIGTYGGYWFRMKLARAFGRDLPAGMLESAFALLLAIGTCTALHFNALMLARLETLN
jgi:uncharacterized membrane protein